jgi:hypothetical protein
MPRRIFPVLPASLFFALMPAVAQEASPDAAKPDVPAATSPAEPKKDWRETHGIPFPSLASVAEASRNMAQALNLREFCANSAVPDDFVRERLARFSRMTGREEDCRSLLDYFRLDAPRPRDGTNAGP